MMKTICMKRMLIQFTLLLLPVMVACTVNSPEITLGGPEDGNEFYAGYDVHFEARLIDSLGLKSYSIEVVAKPEEIDTSGDVVPFTYKRKWELSREKEVFLHHHEIFIARNAAPGAYLFTLSCTNRRGKTAKVTRNIGVLQWPQEVR